MLGTIYAGCPAPTAAPLPAGVGARAMDPARDDRLLSDVGTAAEGKGLSTEGCRELANLLAALEYRSTLLSLLGGRL